MKAKSDILYTARINVKVTPKFLKELHNVALKNGQDTSSYVRSVLLNKMREDK